MHKVSASAAAASVVTKRAAQPPGAALRSGALCMEGQLSHAPQLWPADCSARSSPDAQRLALTGLLLLQGQLADVLYRKALCIGTDSRDAQGVGALVNLQSNDATKVYLLAVFFHMLWNAPLQVGAHLSLSSSTVATVSQDRWGCASPGVGVDGHCFCCLCGPLWPACPATSTTARTCP